MAGKPPVKVQREITVVAALALVVLSALPFFQTLRFGLVWDDSLLLTQVGRVAGSGGVSGLFASDFRLSPDRPLGYYRPVTNTSLWLQIRHAWRSGGEGVLPLTARSLHRVNLLIHMICSFLVWLVCRRLVGKGWVAWLAAAWFSVHPVHVEPVSFVSARTDLLAAMFVLGSLWCWLEARRTSGRVRIAALIIGALLSLAGSLSKEQALLLPVVLVAWSLLLPKKHRHGWSRDRAWLVAWISAAALALVLRAQAGGVGFGPAHELAASGSPAWFVRLGLPALLLYLRLWFLPWPLNSYYTVHDVAVNWLSVAGTAATLLLVWVAVRNHRGREAAAACCFTLVFLAPVLHLAPLGGAVVAERFFYLPSAGLALLTALALAAFEGKQLPRLASRVVVGAAIVAGVLFSVKGARPWASDATLFARMVEVSPRAAAAHRGLAEVLDRAGKLPEAARECREAVRLDPAFTDAYELLGVVSAKQGEHDNARGAFEAALRLAPQRASIHSNLGVLAMDEGNVAEAIEHLRRAATLDPASTDVRYKLGCALLLAGDLEGAGQEAAFLDRTDPPRARALRQFMADAEAEGQPGE